MYTRRYYRKVPPDYGGVAFVKQDIHGITSEEASLSSPFKEHHDELLFAPELAKRVWEGRRLVPQCGQTGTFIKCESDGEGEKAAFADGTNNRLGEESSRQEKSEGGASIWEEIFLLGILLVLLGDGLDEEGILVLVCLLLLLV